MTGAPSRRRLAVVTAIGAAFLVVGAAFAYRPALVVDLVPEVVPVLESIDPELVLVIAGLCVLLFVPTLGIANRLRGAPPRPLAPDRDDAPSPGGEVVGGAIDRAVERATAYDDEPRREREAARETIVETLRPIAAEAYARSHGVGYDAAMADLAAGAWTDDPRAAAFLADEDGPSTPLSLWLFDLLSTADPFSRALERTIDEIERAQSGPEVGP